MATRWSDLKAATEGLDLEFECLCNSINAENFETDLEDNNFTLHSVEYQRGRSQKVDEKEFLKSELALLRQNYAWLESENMRNTKVIEDYYTKFIQLQKLKTELISLVNYQSETIRELQGYKPKKTETITHKERGNIFESFWMLLPVFGLFLTAAWEIARTYQIKSISDLIGFLFGTH